MRHVTLDDLDQQWSNLELAVDASCAIDPWCSGPDWQLPVNLAFAPTQPRILLADEISGGYLLLASYRSAAGGPVLGGLEPLWGFGCPVVGPHPGRLVEAALDDVGPLYWRTMVLPGLPPVPDPTAGDGRRQAHRVPGGDGPTLPIAMALSELGRVGLGEGITRRIADLDGGYDAWLARRSPRFRRNLRRAETAAAGAGLHLVDATRDLPAPAETGSNGSVTDDLFRRLLAIEHRSWKGRDGSGITGVEMTTMYRTMIERLHRRGRLLVHIAVLGGRDVGYIVGGVRGRRYRGLQLSFTADAAHLSVGNLLQAHQLRQLVDDDRADVYDLGMDFEYKRRWSDRAETSVTLIVQR